MNPRPIRVSPKDDFTLTIEFSNGEMRSYDMKPHLEFGIFKELSDLTYFKRARIVDNTVEWPNHQDICPDTLYEDGRPVQAVA
jgi:hypothetical protein